MVPFWSQLQKRAAELLHAVADGKPISLSEVRSFADAVLTSRAVVLAREVQAAAPEHVIARAVELAACLLVNDVQDLEEALSR